MKLIGLTGAAGCGKDTVARFLCDTQGFVQIALADPIRDGLKAMLGVTDEDLSDRAKKEAPIAWVGRSPRYLMQTLGSTWGRDCIDPELWISLAVRRIQRLRQASPCLHINGVVVSDIRLENEGAWLRAQGGALWHIYRRYTHVNLEPDAQARPTERGLTVAPGDQIIRNYGSIEDLHETVAQLFITEEEALWQ